MVKVVDTGGNFNYPRGDSVGNAMVKLASLLNGELAQFNRMAGGAIVQYVDISADGVPAGMSTPCIFYGAMCISGTTPTLALYDAASATGDAILSTGTATAGTFYPAAGVGGVGLGVLLNIGGFADVGGTTPKFRIFFVPAG